MPEEKTVIKIDHIIIDELVNKLDLSGCVTEPVDLDGIKATLEDHFEEGITEDWPGLLEYAQTIIQYALWACGKDIPVEFNELTLAVLEEEIEDCQGRTWFAAPSDEVTPEDRKYRTALRKVIKQLDSQ